MRRPSSRSRTGVFVTDDLIELRDDGEVGLTGRASDLINTAGKKVNPREVEQVILQIDGVREAKVYGEPAGARGEVVAAAVVASPDVTREQIRAFCREHLSPHKVPRIVKLIEAIPVDERGQGQTRRAGGTVESDHRDQRHRDPLRTLRLCGTNSSRRAKTVACLVDLSRIRRARIALARFAPLSGNPDHIDALRMADLRQEMRQIVGRTKHRDADVRPFAWRGSRRPTTAGRFVALSTIQTGMRIASVAEALAELVRRRRSPRGGSSLVLSAPSAGVVQSVAGRRPKRRRNCSRTLSSFREHPQLHAAQRPCGPARD